MPRQVHWALLEATQHNPNFEGKPLLELREEASGQMCFDTPRHVLSTLGRSEDAVHTFGETSYF